jgi:hypothetical protein
MGADWHTFETFLGIEIPLETLKPLRRRLMKDSTKSVFKVHIYEPETHTRTEYEGFDQTLERCTGFLGIVSERLTCKQVASLSEEFATFMKKNMKILNEFGIEVSEPVMRGGISWSVSDYLSDLPDAEDDNTSEVDPSDQDD